MLRSPQRSRGFVLLIVLALLAVLVLLAGSAALASRQAVADATLEQERFQSELDQIASRETLLFMLATHRRTLAGLSLNYIPPSSAELDDNDNRWMPQGNEIRLDGRSYAGLGETLFSLQDDRGLISINWSPRWLRQALYTSMGSEPELGNRLEDARLDYQDGDTLRRLDGAEEDEYRRARLPPPANRTLTSPLELRRVLHWRDILAPLSDEEVLGLLTVTRDTSVNLNTAPERVLSLLPGLGPADAGRLRALREAAPLISMHATLQAFPIVPETEEALNLFANDAGNLILWDRRFGTKRLVHWTLTPVGNTGNPWRIDYEVTLPRGNQSDQPVAGKPETPFFAAPDPPRP